MSPRETSGSPEERLGALGYELPPPVPVSDFTVGARRSGSLLFLGGHGPIRPDGTYVLGQVGGDIDLAAAREAARLTGLSLLRSARDALGTLDEVAGVVRILGMVHAVGGFTQFGRVIDGCSEVFLAVFGEAGRHVRASVGIGGLSGIPVEIEAVMELRA